MVFSSVVFLFYFLLAALAVHLIPCGVRGKNNYLLVLSLLFYAYGEGIWTLLMIGCIAAAYFGGRIIHRHPRHAKTALALSVSVMLTQLFVFKYLSFTLRIFRSPLADHLGLVMPIGISFFTFQAISYVVDVYRGEKPVDRARDLALYVSLFPQLVAGPIVRYETIAKELRTRTTTLAGFAYGIERFMVGFIWKMLLANPMGRIADAAFAQNAQGTLMGPLALMGAIAYTLQIYYDFAAYSHMAIGLGEMFGFHFPENFNYPYISKSVTEFWRRWHISLSTYFRDYVYIPLGGNRCSPLRNLANLFAVWFLTGLWHGAGFNYIAWGLYYFVLLALERYLWHRKFESRTFTLIAVVAGWIFFRANGLREALHYFSSLFQWGPQIGHTVGYYWSMYRWEWIFALLLTTPKTGITARKWLPRLYRPLLFLVFAYAIIRLFTDGFNPFIYFRF